MIIPTTVEEPVQWQLPKEQVFSNGEYFKASKGYYNYLVSNHLYTVRPNKALWNGSKAARYFLELSRQIPCKNLLGWQELTANGFHYHFYTPTYLDLERVFKLRAVHVHYQPMAKKNYKYHTKRDATGYFDKLGFNGVGHGKYYVRHNGIEHYKAYLGNIDQNIRLYVNTRIVIQCGFSQYWQDCLDRVQAKLKLIHVDLNRWFKSKVVTTIIHLEPFKVEFYAPKVDRVFYNRVKWLLWEQFKELCRYMFFKAYRTSKKVGGNFLAKLMTPNCIVWISYGYQTGYVKRPVYYKTLKNIMPFYFCFRVKRERARANFYLLKKKVSGYLCIHDFGYCTTISGTCKKKEVNYSEVKLYLFPIVFITSALKAKRRLAPV